MTLRLLTLIFYPALLIAFISPIIVISLWRARLTRARLFTIFAWLFIIVQAFYIWMWAEVLK